MTSSDHAPPRRAVLAGAALASAVLPAALLPADGLAAAARRPAQVPGVYRRRIGAFQVTALLDGYIPLKPEYWVNFDRPALDAAVAAAALPGSTIPLGITSYLVNTGERLVLIDSGAAGSFGPQASGFADALAAAGVTPAQVDAIIATHLHPDHIAALMRDGRAYFPNATLHLPETDLAYWTSSSAEAGAPGFAKPWFGIARAVAAAYRARLAPFDGTAEPVPGFATMPMPGHTPGQVAVRVSSGDDHLLLLADTVGVAAVQFAHPEAGVAFDVDPARTAATRRRALDMVATDRLLIAAAHLPFPSFGHVLRDGAAYRWQPEEWQFA